MSLTGKTVLVLTSVGALTLLAALSACGDGAEEPASVIILVDSAADGDERDGSLTLREAIALGSGTLEAADLTDQEADNLPDTLGADAADVIGFDPDVFPASQPTTIALTSTLPALTGGNDTISGIGAGVILDAGQQGFDCLIVESSGNAIRGLQIERCLTAIWLRPSASGNRIGGAEASERNVISGNTNVGIRIDGSDNVVQGNYLGTDPTGTESRPNGMEGIWIAAGGTNNLIGGSNPGEGNVISGNKLYGINIGGRGATGNIVRGNYIGVDAGGETSLQNVYGLVLSNGAHDNTIGGPSPGDANIVSGNQSSGLLIRGAQTRDNLIIGNYVGTDPSGQKPVKNGTAIWLLEGAHGNVIGGTEQGEGNVIAHNRIFGVQVEGADTVANTIRGNSLHSNSREGIISEEGGNRGLAAPTVDAAAPVRGSACPSCLVDIYSDSSDEGEVYEGSTTADETGSFTFEGPLAGPFVTATATDAEGNTSPFSERRAVPAR